MWYVYDFKGSLFQYVIIRASLYNWVKALELHIYLFMVVFFMVRFGHAVSWKVMDIYSVIASILWEVVGYVIAQFKLWNDCLLEKTFEKEICHQVHFSLCIWGKCFLFKLDATKFLLCIQEKSDDLYCPAGAKQRKIKRHL